MSYWTEIYKNVQSKVYARKCKNEFEAYERQKKFFLNNPNAELINKEIIDFSSNIIKKILNGSNENIDDFKKTRKKLNDDLTKILINQGLPEDFLSVKYECTVCLDSGKVNNDLCLCAKRLIKQESIIRFKANSMLSAQALKYASFDNFSLDFYSTSISCSGFSEFDIMKSILERCKRYVQEFGLNSKNLLMVGLTGLGKTHLSVAITKEVLKKGFNAIYISAPNLVKIFQKISFTNEDLYLNKEANLIECDLLVIDDLGTEFKTKFSSAMIYNLINSRILKGLPTIISTNLVMKEIANDYKQILVSRIIGHFKRLAFVGNDIRQQKISKNNETNVIF